MKDRAKNINCTLILANTMVLAMTGLGQGQVQAATLQGNVRRMPPILVCHVQPHLMPSRILSMLLRQPFLLLHRGLRQVHKAMVLLAW